MWWTILSRQLGRMIRKGTLAIENAQGQKIQFGTGSPRISVRLTDRGLPRRFLLAPDLTLGEAYMDGTLIIAGDDLKGLLSLLMMNLPDPARPYDPGWGHIPSLLPLVRRLHQHNPLTRARRNVAHHYDLPDELYRLFLDRDLQYSCAYFRAPTDDLDLAQAHKKAHIARKLMLKPGMRVLDIGCGWGGMALTLARDHGVSVVGVTLSSRQHAIACDRARQTGLADRVSFQLLDYRDVSGPFDRIVSVGMFEHVGAPQFDTYFGRIRDLLTDDGVALIHTIGRAAPPAVTGAFIRKYIFPGGYVPALSEAAGAFERQGLWPTDIEVWRLHYARTLQIWRARFEAAMQTAPDMLEARFARLWRYYLCASELSFSLGRQLVFQIQLAKRPDAVPLTRDYMATEPVQSAAY